MNSRHPGPSSEHIPGSAGSESPEHRRRRLQQAQLYVLVDGRDDETEFHRLVVGLAAAGVHILQLRDKRLTDRQMVGRARLLRRLTSGTATLCIVNDRPDIALLADADGVHVGQDELRVGDARRILGGDRLVGVSTHSMDQARQAVSDGADYIGCGPTFPSETKSFDEFAGLSFLKQVARESPVPAFAIGGIDAENLPRVLETGFRRVALSGAIVRSRDPESSARRILALLRAWQGQ